MRNAFSAARQRGLTLTAVLIVALLAAIATATTTPTATADPTPDPSVMGAPSTFNYGGFGMAAADIENLRDGDPSTAWEHYTTIPASAYLSVNLQSVKTITALTVNYETANPQTIRAYISNTVMPFGSGTEIYATKTFDGTRTTATYNLGAGVSGQYIRFQNGTGVQNWKVYEITALGH